MMSWSNPLIGFVRTVKHRDRPLNFYFLFSCYIIFSIPIKPNQTGLSPLAPGQWKGFLAVYAGFWVFNNIIRPVRFTAAVAVSPQLDNVVNYLQDRLNVSKGVAILTTVFLLNVVGTTFFMCSGIALAALAAGVPVFPPK